MSRFTKERHPLFRGVLLIFVLLAGISPLAAQEVVGNIQGIVTDQSGGVIPGVEITVASAQRSLSAVTDATGTYHFLNLPPDTYTVTAKMIGFSTVKRDDILLSLGRTLQINFELKPAATAVTVEVTGTQEAIVDVTSSKTSVNITQSQMDLLPKGLNFSSVLEVAPGARDESKAGGFQIDGASGAENTFIVDGVEVTRLFGGTLGSTKNVPIEFVKEVQVKSAGYEAEYGGATGGVVNVVTKGGTNDFHGEFRLEYTSDTFRGHDNPTLRYNPLDSTSQTAENFFNPYGKNKTRFMNPNFSMGGPLVKDKLWFFGAYAPQFTRETQITQLIKPIAKGDTAVQVLNAKPFDYKTKNDYGVVKLDFAASTKLSLYASYNWSPSKTEGALIGAQTSSQSTFDYARYGFQGGYTPAWSLAFGGTYAPTPKLIFAFRGGKNYLNDKGGSYDIPTGIQRNIISAPCDPAKFGTCPPGTTTTGNLNITADTLTVYDISTRWNVNADATYITRLFGQQHIFRGGYQANMLGNNVFYGLTMPRLYLYYGASDPYTGSSGKYGYYATYYFARSGNVSNSNRGFFLQDQWQIHKRVTINVGVRFENEAIPPYPINASGHPDLSPDLIAQGNTIPISFGWGDKIAPRVGGAWDVFGDGKLKFSASYSVFYDTMKYDLPRGSFGGEVYLREWRALDTLDPNSIKLPTPYGLGGPGELFFGPVDYRYPSNVWGPNDRPGIDPNLHAMKEHEYSATLEYAFTPTLSISGRFTRKALDYAIDDVGGTDAKGNEVYTIGNPGYGSTVEFFTPPTPKAVRRYTGFEFRIDKRFSNRWYSSLSWVNSQLFGNYGGLASSDEDGRANPNANRYFDLPELVYDTHGNAYLGRLATDRPNTLKIYGGYAVPWRIAGKVQETQIGLSQFIYQGIPIQTKLYELTGNGGDYIYPEGRGDMGRTPVMPRTDMLFTHLWKVSEGVSLRAGFNVSNVFDTRRATNINPYYINQNTGKRVAYRDMTDLLTSNGDWKARAAKAKDPLNPLYGLPSSWMGARELRWSFGVQW